MILILLAACAAYLYRLHEPSYWLDEALSLHMSRDWNALWARLLSREANMWLYYVQLHFWQQGSQLEFYTRSMSVGFSLLSIALLFSFSLRLFKNRQIAFISSLVMALNPYMLRYAQETRGYSETLFFGSLATYLLIRAQESQRKLTWVAYGLCVTVALYLHLFIIWVALAHVLWLLSLKRKSWRSWLLGALVAGAGVLSVLIFQPVFRSPQVDWIPPFDIEQFRDLLLNLTGYSRSLQLVYAAALILALTFFFRKRGEESQRLLWLSALLPIVATMVVSISLKPLFIERYFIIIISPAAILIALGVSQLPKRWILSLFLGILCFASLRSIYYSIEDRIQRPRASIREVMTYLSENAVAEDLIIVPRNLTQPEVIDYYDWRFGLAATLESEDFLLNQDEVVTYPQIWLVYRAAASPENMGLPEDYQFVERIQFNRLAVLHYRLRER